MKQVTLILMHPCLPPEVLELYMEIQTSAPRDSHSEWLGSEGGLQFKQQLKGAGCSSLALNFPPLSPSPPHYLLKQRNVSHPHHKDIKWAEMFITFGPSLLSHFSLSNLISQCLNRGVIEAKSFHILKTPRPVNISYHKSVGPLKSNLKRFMESIKICHL